MTETETTITAMCRTLLHLASVEADDDLLNLGADSLMLVELAMELEEKFAIAVPVKAVERAPRVRDIAAWVDATRAAGDE